MKLTNLFKREKTQRQSALSHILTGDKELPQDHPNVIVLAVEIVSEYGQVLENTSGSFVVPEETLPFPKTDIQKSIELLLHFLRNNNSWGDLKDRYPNIAEEIINKTYYQALRNGYVELAKFIPKDDSNLCMKASVFLSDHTKRVNNAKDAAKGIKEKPWLSAALSMIIKIEENKIQRLNDLIVAYGEGDFICS